jgi:hypothetical protein
VRETIMIRKIKEITVAMVSILAFMAVISESPYFPWSNFGGLLLMAVIVHLIVHVIER